MLAYKLPLSRDLMSLIWAKKWEESGGAEHIEDHIYDHLDSLMSDLEEEGLPSGTCHEATVAALLDVCAVSMGKVKTSALVNRLIAGMLVDPELPV